MQRSKYLDNLAKKVAAAPKAKMGNPSNASIHALIISAKLARSGNTRFTTALAGAPLPSGNQVSYDSTNKKEITVPVVPVPDAELTLDEDGARPAAMVRFPAVWPSHANEKSGYVEAPYMDIPHGAPRTGAYAVEMMCAAEPPRSMSIAVIVDVSYSASQPDAAKQGKAAAAAFAAGRVPPPTHMEIDGANGKEKVPVFSTFFSARSYNVIVPIPVVSAFVQWLTETNAWAPYGPLYTPARTNPHHSKMSKLLFLSRMQPDSSVSYTETFSQTGELRSIKTTIGKPGTANPQRTGAYLTVQRMPMATRLAIDAFERAGDDVELPSTADIHTITIKGFAETTTEPYGIPVEPVGNIPDLVREFRLFLETRTTIVYVCQTPDVQKPTEALPENLVYDLPLLTELSNLEEEAWRQGVPVQPWLLRRVVSIDAALQKLVTTAGGSRGYVVVTPCTATDKSAAAGWTPLLLPPYTLNPAKAQKLADGVRAYDAELAALCAANPASPGALALAAMTTTASKLPPPAAGGDDEVLKKMREHPLPDIVNRVFNNAPAPEGSHAARILAAASIDANSDSATARAPVVVMCPPPLAPDVVAQQHDAYLAGLRKLFGAA
jgi:hypothetical protein